MRKADTILAVIHDRGKRGLPLERVYRLLFNPDLYLRAYGNLYANQGAMTPGTTEETVDRMSLAKIQVIIKAVRAERYRWQPARRVYIPKVNGKKRPLGVQAWSDKLVQEVIRMILEAYYEPQFSDYSHGFRPRRSCHTALQTIRNHWTGTKWFIEGDVKGCFDHIDHSVLLEILGEKIHDNRFLGLIAGMLRAGYLEDWKRYDTLSGTPQGGVASPILSNIYLDRLDQWVEGALFKDYNRGEDKRKSNLEYQRALYHKQRCRKAGDITGAKRWNKIQRQLPRYDVNDPDYRRLRYLRYADDFLLGFAGPKTEAGEIKSQLQAFLRDTLKLELSEEKTLITHSRTQAARFLGYDITNQHDDAKRDHRNARSINGVMALRVPAEVVAKHCIRYLKKGKPVHRTELTRNSDFDIVIRYQGEYRGVVNYYLLAHNLWWLNKVRWVMETSLLKTLAHKHKSSVMKMRKRYQTVVQTEYGPRKCLQVRVERIGKNPLIATFGGVPLRRRYGLLYKEPQLLHLGPQRTELVQRLLADQCELCHSRENVQVHHVKALKSLKVKGRREKPTWMQIMAARRRKTLIVCQPCHSAIHAGKPTRTPAVE